ncbi:MAG TPA: alpha/beta fold hydrolase [Vicinamibacterales bacterium]|nr:alpha/beta fold hydrolase [Vicinamibacterales bacterium]
MASSTQLPTMTAHEADQIARANASGLQPVVFVHGLWLLPNSWERWAAYFEEQGYVALAPGWPDDPQTVAEGKARPEVFANKSIGDIADYQERIIVALDKTPALIGHSFGGLLVQILAGHGVSAATVSISPAPMRGTPPLGFSAVKSAWPVLKNPANWHRAVPLTFDEFRYGFANVVSQQEAQGLFEQYAVPGSGMTVFQSANANLNPWTEAQVDFENLRRGPMLIIAAEEDHTVPPAVAQAAYKHQQLNINITEFVEMHARGHALTVDHGWKDVADNALTFIRRFV